MSPPGRTSALLAASATACALLSGALISGAFIIGTIVTGTARAQDAADAAPRPELVDAYLAFERQPGSGATLDGEPLYFLSALKVSGETLSLYRQVMVCRDARMQVVPYGGTYWYEGVSMAQGDLVMATLGMTGCDDCGRAVTAEPEPHLLRQPLSFPDPHTARLGDVLYDRRMPADTRDCPVDATAADAPSTPRTE